MLFIDKIIIFFIWYNIIFKQIRITSALSGPTRCAEGALARVLRPFGARQVEYNILFLNNTIVQKYETAVWGWRKTRAKGEVPLERIVNHSFRQVYRANFCMYLFKRQNKNIISTEYQSNTVDVEYWFLRFGILQRVTSNIRHGVLILQISTTIHKHWHFPHQGERSG